ncbi:hypothetical protein D9M69_721270 [compost metagenome]
MASWARRLVIASVRKRVSRDMVCSTTSAYSWIGDLPKLVMQTVRAPASLASRVASTVSCVLPECEMVSTATSGPVSDALMACTWESVTAVACSPMRSMR